MTKAILTMDESSNLMFDCINHADDHDACTIASTLCNALVVGAERKGYEPTIYNSGHVRLDIMHADAETVYLFQTVYQTLQEAAQQHPEYIRTY